MNAENMPDDDTRTINGLTLFIPLKCNKMVHKSDDVAQIGHTIALLAIVDRMHDATDRKEVLERLKERKR